MGTLTIIATKPIFPVRKDKDEDESTPTEFSNVLRKGSNHPMLLSFDEKTGDISIKFNKQKSEKNPKEYTAWGYMIPRTKLITYHMETYPPESNKLGFSKLAFFIEA